MVNLETQLKQLHYHDLQQNDDLIRATIDLIKQKEKRDIKKVLAYLFISPFVYLGISLVINGLSLSINKQIFIFLSVSYTYITFLLFTFYYYHLLRYLKRTFKLHQLKGGI